MMNVFTKLGDVSTPNIARGGYVNTISVDAQAGVKNRTQVWVREDGSRIDIYSGVESSLYKVFYNVFDAYNNKRRKGATEKCVTLSGDTFKELCEMFAQIPETWEVETVKKATSKTSRRKKEA